MPISLQDPIFNIIRVSPDSRGNIKFTQAYIGEQKYLHPQCAKRFLWAIAIY